MSKLLSTIVFGLVVMANPALGALPEWIIPSPITIAVQVGKWIISKDNNQEVYYVRVQATGTSETNARNEAFRLAVDQAVGSLLVSETKISNGDLKQHDVINYNSGYIQDFEYVKIHRNNGNVTLQIDVYVSKSKLAERISFPGETQEKLQGGKIAEAFRSMHRENQTGDHLLRNVLNDFPNRALDINVTNISYTPPNRRPTLNVNYSVQWKPQYVNAFKEAVSNVMHSLSTKDRPSADGITFVDNKGCFFACYASYVTDHNRFNVLHSGLQNHAYIMISLRDIHNNSVYSTCMDFNHNLLKYNQNGTYNLYEDSIYNYGFTMDLGGIDVSRLDTVDLKIVSQNECNL